MSAQRRARVDQPVAVLVSAPAAPRSVANRFMIASIAAGLVMPCCIEQRGEAGDVRRRHRRARERTRRRRVEARRAVPRRAAEVGFDKIEVVGLLEDAAGRAPAPREVAAGRRQLDVRPDVE